MRALVGLAVLVAGLVGPGCSSKASKCDSTKCSAGNTCIDDGSGPRCHLICTKQGDCPFGYYCNDSRPQSWCAQNTLAFPAQPNGQWGAPCTPPKESGNAACDAANGFGCYGISPTDASAFCTQFGCLGDSDCVGGWWCATVNVDPNVTTVNSSFGTKPRQVCLPRWYCSPCQLDHDCAPTLDGRTQYCVGDSKGNGYCTPRCTANANCNADAQCAPRWNLCLGGSAAQQACTRDEDCPPSAQNVAQHCDFGPVSGGMLSTMGVCAPECGSETDCNTAAGQHCQTTTVKYCTPRAGVCKGDGSLCSPCRSDADCAHGYCVEAPYSGERFCSQMATNMNCTGGCPMTTGAGSSKSACTTMASDFAPANQCVGVVSLGGMDVPGCWTASH